MPIRIALAGLPRMLDQIVCALLEKQDDFEVVLELEDRDALVERVEHAGVDVVILASSEGGSLDSVDTLLRAHPRLKVFALTPNGRDAFRVELRPKAFPIKEVSSRRLVHEIRAALADSPPPDPAPQDGEARGKSQP